MGALQAEQKSSDATLKLILLALLGVGGIMLGISPALQLQVCLETPIYFLLGRYIIVPNQKTGHTQKRTTCGVFRYST